MCWKGLFSKTLRCPRLFADHLLVFAPPLAIVMAVFPVGAEHNGVEGSFRELVRLFNGELCAFDERF